jgi:hypothetical protein
MTGETNLATLLATMSPVLMTGEFVFLSFPDAVYGDYANLKPIASVVEAEGLTLVVEKTRADLVGAQYQSSFSDAIGLTAAFSAKLNEHGISANVIAGYFHDHIFVQSADAERAITALQQLSA